MVFGIEINTTQHFLFSDPGKDGFLVGQFCVRVVRALPWLVEGLEDVDQDAVGVAPAGQRLVVVDLELRAGVVRQDAGSLDDLIFICSDGRSTAAGKFSVARG